MQAREKFTQEKKIMQVNPLRQLETLGQSIWLDYIKRSLIRQNTLKNFHISNLINKNYYNFKEYETNNTSIISN